jgi:hypothetical protein
VTAYPTKNVRPFPLTIPLTADQKQRIQPIQDQLQSAASPAKPKPRAAYKIKPPRSVDDFSENPAGTISFPPGTITTNLRSIIRSKFRSPNHPLPPFPENATKPENPFLPLEVFDDLRYAQFSIEELLQAPEAFSQFTDIDGVSVWRRCTCIGYDPANELFTIHWDDSDKTKKVTSFNIRFACESEDIFNQRLETSCSFGSTSALP